jgi:flavin-dependent dehydrogenase
VVRTDVLVVGGGPAGCAAARLLALWGHDVLQVAKPPVHGPHLAESIPPSTGKLFDVLGVREQIDAGPFVRSTGNTVWWGSDAARIEAFAGGGRGWQVTAAALEPILQTAAVDAGVRLEQGRLTADDAAARGAAWTLDCTGRAGVIARAKGWRVPEPAHRTIALVGRWRPRKPFDLPDPTHTLIESYENGWAWSVPDAEGCRYVAVMVDPRTSDLTQNQTSRAVYESEIAKTDRLAKLLGDATLTGGPFGWDAAMYSATRFADEGVLLVGDAGSFIDPLSSAGVKKALASGWLAAVATHTALTRPAMRHTALDFFSAREKEIYAAFRALTERFLADAAATYDHPFWSDRTDPVTESNDDALRAAFDRLRSADSIRLRAGPDVTIEQRAAVSGNEIVLERRLVSGAGGDSVRYAFDVDLVALIDLAPQFAQVPDLFDAYNQRLAPVALPQFLSALAMAIAKGWLVDSRGPSP